MHWMRGLSSRAVVVSLPQEGHVGRFIVILSDGGLRRCEEMRMEVGAGVVLRIICTSERNPRQATAVVRGQMTARLCLSMILFAVKVCGTDVLENLPVHHYQKLPVPSPAERFSSHSSLSSQNHHWYQT